MFGAIPMLAGFMLLGAVDAWWQWFKELRRKPTIFQPLQTDHFLWGAIIATGIGLVLQAISFIVRWILIRSDDGTNVGFWRVLFAGCNIAGLAFGIFMICTE